MSIELEPHTLAFADFTVKAHVPADWREAAVGDQSQTFTRPGRSFANSVLWISSTCQGNCATLNENIAGSCKTQVDAHGRYYTGGVDVVFDEALDGGGRRFLLDLRRGETQHRQYVVFHLQPGWPRAIMTSFLAVQQEDLDAFEARMSLCDDIEITRT